MTRLEWQDQFSTDEACRKYLFDQRWPNGFVCPKCQGTKKWNVQRSGRTAPVYECAACGHQASVTAGTIFHRTKVALRIWFWAIFEMATDKGGKSALTLSRDFGLPYVTVTRPVVGATHLSNYHGRHGTSWTCQRYSSIPGPNREGQGPRGGPLC